MVLTWRPWMLPGWPHSQAGSYDPLKIDFWLYSQKIVLSFLFSCHSNVLHMIFFSKMHLDCNIILTEQQHLKCKEDIWRHLLDPKISWSTIEILIEQTFFWYLFKIFYPFQWSFLFLHPKKPVRIDRTQPLIALDRWFFSSQMRKHNSSSGHWPTAPKRTQHVDHEQSTEAPSLWVCSCVWRTIDSLAIIN